MGISPQLVVLEIVKMRLDLELDHGRRRVGQVVLFNAVVHNGWFAGGMGSGGGEESGTMEGSAE